MHESDSPSATAVLIEAPAQPLSRFRRLRQHPLAWAMLVGLLLRLAVMPFTFGDLRDPTRNYWRFGWETGRVAMAVASGHGYSSPLPINTGPSAWLPPAYPLLLAAVFRVFGIFTASSAFVILLLNAIFSVFTCIPIFFITRHSFGEKAAIIAAWLWAIFPYAVYYSVGLVWETCLSTLLFAIVFLMALQLDSESSWARWIGWGALWGILALSNPALLATLPFLLAWILVRHSFSTGRRIAAAILTLVTLAAVATPWTLRNYRVFHRLIPLRDNFWMELYFGNTGDLSEIMPDWVHPSTSQHELDEFQQLGEIGYNQQKKKIVLEWIRQHPGQFAVLCLRRVSNWWTGYWSFDREYLINEPYTYPNMIFVIGTTLLMLAGLWFAFARCPGAAVPYVLVLISFPIVYYITHDEIQYRHPVEPMMVALCAYAVHVFQRSREVTEQSADVADAVAS
jgi:hypothetical protein